ncbi:MAG: TonB-dependent receptor [Bryobacterales bacterium]|nr:TonB-dependent receptor [Bryobacterales bacterium]
MGIQSAASSSSRRYVSLPNVCLLVLLVVILALVPGALLAQLTTGVIEGTLRTPDGRPLAGSPILITGGTGFRTVIHSNSNGGFSITLPYGQYRFSPDMPQATQPSGAAVFVAPLQTGHIDLIVDASGSMRVVQPAARTPGIWADATRGSLYPEAFSLPGLLVSREPSSVTEPLDLTGLGDNRLAIESQRAISWTATQYKLLGMDATDSYQPGLPAIFPDVQALEEIVVRSAFAQTASSSDATEVGLFLGEPGASWHGALSTANTGRALSSTNLPAPASRGLVQQADQFRWFTRDRLEVGGPLTRWADFFASGTGQWVAQTEPLAAPGTDQRSRLLFGNARGRVRATDRDRFDALFSGSRIDLSDGGVPAGLEALTGNRMAPFFALPGGFPGEPEVDHLDFFQVGWTHLLPESSHLGLIEVRYGYSVAHLDTNTVTNGQSRIELFSGVVSGAPPLGNLAVRTRHGIEAAWQPAALRALGTRHQIVAGGGWKRSEPRNRFATPSGMNLISADGAPALVMQFNTPLYSRELVRSFSAYVADHVSLTPSLSLDLGVFADFARGSLPAQPDLIVWNNLSPRAGFAWQLPHSHGLVLRGTYFRLYTPLAGRYLDFGNPNSLGGSAYQSIAGGQGSLLFRFGGPYSSISPDLHRPYSDEFDIGAEFPLTRTSIVSVHLFRRDDKNRIAAINTGVPAQAFTPVSILDPGPDGIPGTFDDQQLTVYAQNPATLGQDRYLLTNPAGLRMLNTGVLAEAATEWRRLTLRASFLAEKSYGPTNPGDPVYENDPGVIGALFLDPNTAIHAAGRSFVDRAYVAKIQATYRLPSAWGGIELASVADYMDGLVFARQLLVAGLPQGPFVVATTVRGSPEGGNRAEYVINWNLRLIRQFRLAVGRLALSAEVLNVTNAAQRLQEDDRSGPSFNLRLPVSIQPPRMVRLGFRYEF